MFNESYRKAVVRVLIHIESHTDEKLSLQALSKVAGISQFHFHRIFTAYMGVSLGQYIKTKRIEKGLQEVAHTDKKVIDIALSSGYESPTSFNKAFRKEVGSAPTELRKGRQDKEDLIMSHLRQWTLVFFLESKL